MKTQQYTLGDTELTRKYVEQWLFWIAVDVVCCYLYVVKGIPFKAGLYGLYVVIAVMGTGQNPMR